MIPNRLPASLGSVAIPLFSIMLFACTSPAVGQQPILSTPPPPPPPPHVDICVSFPHSLLGGAVGRGGLPSFFPGNWAGGSIDDREFANLADLVEDLGRLQFGGGRRAYAVAMDDLMAATLSNLRTPLDKEERSRRQQIAFGRAVQSLRTALVAPNDIRFPHYRRPLEKFAIITWLLEYVAAKADEQASEDRLLAMVEPLAWITGMSLADSLSAFANPAYQPGLGEGDLKFAKEILRYPGGVNSTFVVPRALHYSLDSLSNKPASRSPLFRELDQSVQSYFARAPRPWVSPQYESSREPAEIEKLISNRLFLEVSERNSPSDIANPPGAETDSCSLQSTPENREKS